MENALRKASILAAIGRLRLPDARSGLNLMQE